MIKQILVLLCIYCDLQAVILTNGADVDQEIIAKVWPILEDLGNKHKIAIINDLYKAAYSKDRKVKPNGLVWGWISNKLPEAMQDSMFKEALEKNALREIITLGLCNLDGVIGQQTAEIIKASIKYISYQSIYPISYSIRSPLSWKNYFSIEYWRK